MKTLDDTSTFEDIEDFLLYHMEDADDRKSKINPSLTKEDVWNIHMGAIAKNSAERVRELMIEHLTKEFGNSYD